MGGGSKCQKLLVQEDGNVTCHCLTFEDGTNRLSINGIYYQSVLYNMPEE